MLIGIMSIAEFKLSTISKVVNPLAIHLIINVPNQNIKTANPSHFPKLFIFSLIGISLVPASSIKCEILPISVLPPVLTVIALPFPVAINVP